MKSLPEIVMDNNRAQGRCGCGVVLIADPAHRCPLSSMNRVPSLPQDYKARKEIPICTGVLDYFPKSLAEVARVSYEGNKQHNPGEPLHWAKGKSQDEEDAHIRHWMERYDIDGDGVYHAAKAAWRNLAFLEKLLEAKELGMSYQEYNQYLKTKGTKIAPGRIITNG